MPAGSSYGAVDPQSSLLTAPNFGRQFSKVSREAVAVVIAICILGLVATLSNRTLTRRSPATATAEGPHEAAPVFATKYSYRLQVGTMGHLLLTFFAYFLILFLALIYALVPSCLAFYMPTTS